METMSYKRSKLTDFFYKVNMIIYITGFPNFWIEDFNISKMFIKVYNRITKINSIIIVLWLIFQYGALFTQNNLSNKQLCSLIFNLLSVTIILIYYFILSHRKGMIMEAFYNLSVALKRIHSDPEIEKGMIARSKSYIAAFMITCAITMAMQSFDAYSDVVKNNETFTTVITAYPDVKEKSNLANIVRTICHIIWWIYGSRAMATYILVLSLTISLSYQYKNLQSYFYSLDDIFNRNDLSQRQKETQYEKQFKVGIGLHFDTIRCTSQCQTICNAVYSGQIILNLLCLLLVMVQKVNSENNFLNWCATLTTATVILLSTGFIMWNAGDVTIEAALVPTAMYFSGWQNCQGQSSIRIRKLVTIAMNQAQKPVILKGFGYIELSYAFYMRIVKASYSVFSVFT